MALLPLSSLQVVYAVTPHILDGSLRLYTIPCKLCTPAGATQTGGRSTQGSLFFSCLNFNPAVFITFTFYREKAGFGFSLPFPSSTFSPTCQTGSGLPTSVISLNFCFPPSTACVWFVRPRGSLWSCANVRINKQTESPGRPATLTRKKHPKPKTKHHYNQKPARCTSHKQAGTGYSKHSRFTAVWVSPLPPAQ